MYELLGVNCYYFVCRYKSILKLILARVAGWREFLTRDLNAGASI